MEGKACEAAIKRRRKTIAGLKDDVKAMRRCHKLKNRKIIPKRHRESVLRILGLKFDSKSNSLYW